jgi:hypothetical protein
MEQEQLVAAGSPTKQFFVDMLTRDIDIKDAILDLLDNCLDGVVRLKGPDQNPKEQYYSGYEARINITDETFSISDNCGGIPLEVAQKYAFRMGRSPETGTKDGLPTVGVYGIGMKRAIFKIGECSIIETRYTDEAYKVTVNEEWKSEESNWDFPIKRIPVDDSLEKGTIITVTKLNENIKNLWNSQQNLTLFIDDLKKSIQESYSFIMQKGFKIILNSVELFPSPIQLLISRSEEANGLKPYIFEKDYYEGRVNVKLVLGFYKSLQTAEEDEEIAENKRTSAQAGWTITCNDRVVIYNDKTHLTGWGEAGVPSYHTQFIGICGVVMFQSSDPKLLPMTTTKRGIDLSSPIYADIKNTMRESLKLFTGYTNKWKGRIKEERDISSKAEKVSVLDVFTNTSSYGIELKSKKDENVFKPNLPSPNKDTKIKYIRYSKSEDEIKQLSQYLFGEYDENVITPSRVGEQAFDKLYGEMRDESHE